MNQAALDATAWNDATRTSKGGAVTDALRPFVENPVALADRLPDLEDRLAPALAAFGLTGRRIAIVSATNAFEPMYRMADDKRADYMDGMLSLVGKPLTRSVGWMLHDAYRASVNAACGDVEQLKSIAAGLMAGIIVPQRTRPEMKLAAALGALPVGLMATMFFLVTLTAYDLPGQDVVASLAKLYLDGNFPIGLQHDGSFVVLVR